MPPFVTQHPKLRYALPVPHRRLSLWRGCVFALNPRETYGQYGTSQQTAAYDHVSRNRATVLPWPGMAPDGYMSNNSVLGWAIKSYTGTTARINFVRTIPLADNPGVTIACMMRFTAALPGIDRVIMSQRYSALATQPGIALYVTAANKFRLCFADGVNNQNIDSLTDADPTFTRLLVGRFRKNGNSEIWINGVLDNYAATTNGVGTVNRAVSFFNSAGTAGNALAAQVGFGAMWTRAITNQEIALLHTDPWVMWRQPQSKLGFAQLMEDCDCDFPRVGQNPVNVAPDCEDFHFYGQNPVNVVEECDDCQWWPVGAKARREGPK